MVRGMGVDPCLVSRGGRGGGGMVRAVRWCMRSVINKATIKNFFCYFHYQRICIKKKFSVVCVCPWGSHTRRLGPMSDWKRTPLTHSDKPFSRVFCNIPKHNSQRKERERKSSLVWFHACGQAFLLLRLLSSWCSRLYPGISPMLLLTSFRFPLAFLWDALVQFLAQFCFWWIVRLCDEV